MMKYLTVKEISSQVSSLIKSQADQGLMLPKTPVEIEYAILIGWGFYELDGDVVTAFAIIYEWKNYVEIGGLITHPDYYGQGLCLKVTSRALEVAKTIGDKPIIALVNEKSTGIFEKLDFFYQKMSRNSNSEKFWEPCKQVCIDYGRWPACNCHFMLYEKDSQKAYTKRFFLERKAILKKQNHKCFGCGKKLTSRMKFRLYWHIDRKIDEDHFHIVCMECAYKCWLWHLNKWPPLF